MEWKAAAKLPESRRRTLIENVGVALLCWATLLILVLFEVFPYYPHTKLGWGIFIGLGPVTYLFGMLIFEGGGELLERLRSPLRIAIKFIVILCWVMACLWMINRNIVTGQ